MVRNQVFNTGSLTLDTEKEHIFVSVTPDYQKGPGIQRRAVSFSHQNIKSKSDHRLCKMRSDRQLLKYMLSLIEKLKQVKDFRKDKGKRHPLWIVLVVIILGTMLGYSGYRELGEFAKNNRHRLSQQFNIIPERVPSYSTIRRVMMGVEWQSLLKIANSKMKCINA